jgi:hypothetical protein
VINIPKAVLLGNSQLVIAQTYSNPIMDIFLKAAKIFWKFATAFLNIRKFKFIGL